MKTKEEVIKEAWVSQVGLKRYEALKNDLINDGFLHYQPSDLKDSEIKTKDGFLFYRPKSLRGIENNNMWIRIKSEGDLPKKIIECVTCFYDGENYILGDTRERNPIQLWKSFKNNQITHYKPSIKHEKPLY